MPSTVEPNLLMSTERVVAATPREIFAAFERPELLAQWWGPKRFTNTFEVFEFKPGGRWVFVMHGPNGANYPNESVFLQIEPDSKIVLEHLVMPWFILTITLTARGDKTHLSWVGQFESPEAAARMRKQTSAANEEVLDRLEALVASARS
ncbi:MAG: SRPBCC domain-containing protein [Chloroflexota bacterium]